MAVQKYMEIRNPIAGHVLARPYRFPPLLYSLWYEIGSKLSKFFV
jgi:hypothetical protein